MSELEMVSVGQALRDAREAQKISLDDVALRLRLMHRQIEAMETDDFESLGQPVFARGFVRNYARLLGLEPDPLLERMGGAPFAAPVAQPEAPMPTSWLTSPWLIMLLLGVLVMVAVPVSLYLWLNSDAGEMLQSAQTMTDPSAKPAPAPVVTPSASEPAALPTDAEVQPAAADASATEAAAAVNATDVPPTPAAATPGVVHLEFGEESWVEVKDATGRMVHRQLNPAGSSVDIQGQPPFAMVIGNAAQAHMTYNGRPIDLKPYIDVTVARFTLEE
jgi:cytoskeleton protein RodZ